MTRPASMDFFGLQEQARRRTALLLVLYVLAVLGMIVAVYGVVRAVLVEVRGTFEIARWWQPGLFLAVAGGVLAIVAAGSAAKSAELATTGGAGVAERLGGRRLVPNTGDLAERRLLNVVEEMALAAGLPVPRVYVLDQERAINAFAAGFSPRDAVIGVTRGALDALTRDELQGVIGHEFSHILYGDMRLNLRLIGVLHGILLLSLLGQGMLRALRQIRWTSGRRRGQGGGAALLMMLVLGVTLWVVGWIGAALASLIRAAVARQREFLADAASAQFTRNPSGLAGALKKIAGWSHGGRITVPSAPEAAHLFFVDALGFCLDRLLASHPPLAERIRRLEPGGRAGRAAQTWPEWPATAMDSGAAALVAAAGTVTPAALDWARALRQEIPPALLEAAHEPEGARAIVYGLLLREGAESRAVIVDVPAIERLQRLAPLLAELRPAARLPLIEMAMPALRQMSAGEYRQFRERMLQLIQADERVNLFEYALIRMIERHLDPVFGRMDTAPQRHRRLDALEAEAKTVLAALARWGARDEETIVRAWHRALQRLGRPAEGRPPEVSLDDVHHALQRLRTTAPSVRRVLLDACAVSVAEDERLDPIEADLLRAIADALDCPLPPLSVVGVASD
ncbi:MAG: M48 family metallopeptidase [Kiritimatiellae bacterium]|nr:M48 family metallopeptidase [Kiritimatiellia bacterium]